MLFIQPLTTAQEVALLTLIGDKYTPIANGASRMTFSVQSEDLISCGINVTCNCIIKLAIGIAGINQSAIETAAFRTYGDSYPLAKILYIGHYIEIMEKLHILDEDSTRGYIDFDSPESYAEELEEVDRLSYGEAYHVWMVAKSLEDINGKTSDNGQLGYTDDGDLVAYDYGYESESDKQLCSDLNECINFYEREDLQKYTQALINIISYENDAVQQLESKLFENYNNDVDNLWSNI